MQFEFALWTREMVREVIRREFGVALSVVSVGPQLRKLGMCRNGRCTVLISRILKRSIGGRSKNTRPSAQAEAAGATVSFADEAGIRSDYHAALLRLPFGQGRRCTSRRPVLGEHDLRGVR